MDMVNFHTIEKWGEESIVWTTVAIVTTVGILAAGVLGTGFILGAFSNSVPHPITI